MINARPGYWDIDRCCWVGTEPMYVVPPARTGDHTPDHEGVLPSADPPPVPAPRHRRAGDGSTATAR